VWACSGVELSEVEWRAVEWSEVEWKEWSRVWAGVEWKERSGGELTVPLDLLDVEYAVMKVDPFGWDAGTADCSPWLTNNLTGSGDALTL
jgi:hypothetical protein